MLKNVLSFEKTLKKIQNDTEIALIDKFLAKKIQFQIFAWVGV